MKIVVFRSYFATQIIRPAGRRDLRELHFIMTEKHDKIGKLGRAASLHTQYTQTPAVLLALRSVTVAVRRYLRSHSFAAQKRRRKWKWLFANLRENEYKRRNEETAQSIYMKGRCLSARACRLLSNQHTTQRSGSRAIPYHPVAGDHDAGWARMTFTKQHHHIVT